jgi:hypothetical protein
MHFISPVITAEAGDQKECSNAGNQPDDDSDPKVNCAALHIDGPAGTPESCEQVVLPGSNCREDRQT